MRTARCTKEKVQCPYYVCTDYPMCPATAPCIKKYEHRTNASENPCPSTTQCEAWLEEFFRKAKCMPLDIVTRLRPRWSDHLIQKSLLPATYAHGLPKKPRITRSPNDYTHAPGANTRKRRDNFQ